MPRMTMARAMVFTLRDGTDPDGNSVQLSNRQPSDRQASRTGKAFAAT